MNPAADAPADASFYRGTTLGLALQDALEGLSADDELASVDASAVLEEFDKARPRRRQCLSPPHLTLHGQAMLHALDTRLRSARNASISGAIEYYNHVDAMWRFMATDVTIDAPGAPSEPLDRVLLLCADAKAVKAGPRALDPAAMRTQLRERMSTMRKR